MSAAIRWIAALVIAGVLSFGSFFLGQQAEQASQPISAPSVTVYQAVQDISLGYTFGDLISAGAIKEISIPTYAAPEGTITPDSIPDSGKILSLNLRAGQLLSQLQFRAFDELIQATGVNPKAFQVTIALSDEQAVAGLVRAGSEVTIYATYQVPVDAGTEFVTEIVIPRASVSLVGLADSTRDDRGGIIYLTLTLEAEEAQRLVHFVKSADLHVSLFGAQAEAAQLGPIYGYQDQRTAD